MLLAAHVGSRNRFAITPMTLSARVQFELPVRGRMNTKRSDLRVAAIANESGATVVTRNRRDSGRMSAPKIEDWTT